MLLLGLFAFLLSLVWGGLMCLWFGYWPIGPDERPNTTAMKLRYESTKIGSDYKKMSDIPNVLREKTGIIDDALVFRVTLDNGIKSLLGVRSKQFCRVNQDRAILISLKDIVLPEREAIPGYTLISLTNVMDRKIEIPAMAFEQVSSDFWSMVLLKPRPPYSQACVRHDLKEMGAIYRAGNTLDTKTWTVAILPRRHKYRLFKKSEVFTIDNGPALWGNDHAD